MRLKPFLAALLVAFIMPAASALAGDEAKTLYAQANFYINKGWISSINYRVGTLMPIGTKVQLQSLKGSEAVLKVVDPEVIEVDRRRNIELWDNAWALAVAILLFALEWIMRRRSGYL